MSGIWCMTGEGIISICLVFTACFDDYLSELLTVILALVMYLAWMCLGKYRHYILAFIFLVPVMNNRQ